MTPTGPDDLSRFSMMDLFRQETDNQTVVLVEGLLSLERDPAQKPVLETLMRAAHSLKGAARMVERNEAVEVAHAVEDCFVATQNGDTVLSSAHIDVLLQGVDLLKNIAMQPDVLTEEVQSQLKSVIAQFLAKLADPPARSPLPDSAREDAVPATGTQSNGSEPVETPAAPERARGESEAPTHGGDRTSPLPNTRHAGAQATVRVSASNIDRLIALAGESVIATRWLGEFGKELQALKRLHSGLSASHHRLSEALLTADCGEHVLAQTAEIRSREIAIRQMLNERMDDLSEMERHLSGLSNNLYHSVLDCRMRPFADGVQGLPRMVRDVARSLNKEVDFEISCEGTSVDRDVLELIESPLGHLLRNAIDHGIETPAERVQRGKPAAGKVRLEARHFAGSLLVVVEDDGRGIELDALRRVLLERKLVTPEMAESLTEKEVLEFLFLPGFTLKSTVTDVSGRGVGLDAVQTMVREIGGTVAVSSQPNRGTRFELKLPLTLSVIRTLIFEVSAETFALPLARVTSVLTLPRTQVQTTEGRQHFLFGESQVGLVMAHQVLGFATPTTAAEDLAVIVMGDEESRYAVVVDKFLDESELVVRPLDPRLGKVQNIHAAALLPDQSPVLIIDPDDFIHSIRRLVSEGGLAQVLREANTHLEQRRKRVLVVDDSLTVRELERKLIASRGYVVEVAIDGMEAWNAIRTGRYDLVVTDVDMPRMDGITLVGLIKNDARLKSLPVMIVSYKDREEDRRRGLEAQADYYLTKASFHDESLLTAVEDLIGEATL